jgi:hypothetical protein
VELDAATRSHLDIVEFCERIYERRSLTWFEPRTAAKLWNHVREREIRGYMKTHKEKRSVAESAINTKSIFTLTRAHLSIDSIAALLAEALEPALASINRTCARLDSIYNGRRALEASIEDLLLD